MSVCVRRLWGRGERRHVKAAEKGECVTTIPGDEDDKKRRVEESKETVLSTE